MTTKLGVLLRYIDSCMHFFFFKGNPVKKEDIFVAVKTCKKFHGDRSMFFFGLFIFIEL